MVREENNYGATASDASHPCHVCTLDPECIPWALVDSEYGTFEKIVKHIPELRQGEHLFQVGDNLTAIYAVRTGTFKTYAFDSQGDEHVLGFTFPGELVGFDGVYSRRHGCSTVATEESAVCALPYFDLASLMKRSPMLREQVLRLASQDFGDRVVNTSLAPEARFAKFLLDMHTRTGNGDASEPMNLRISTCDLANYLRVTVLEIEGLFDYYRRRNIINKDGNRLELLDLDSLQYMALQKNTK